MSIKSIIKSENLLPTGFNDFFRPWNDWFDGSWVKTLNVPAVNIAESDTDFKISVATPGLKKEDLKVDIDGDILTISAEKEENKEEKDKKYTRKEYNYSSFSRSFTIPDEVTKDKIEANYQEGVLKLTLPKGEKAKKTSAKSIAVK
jgi:HSP20 family protein